MEHRITFGADPEFFVAHRPTGKIVPVCGLFGGNKKAPVALSEEGGYLEDGAVIEFNVAPDTSLSGLRERLGRLYTLFEKKFPDYEIQHRRAAFTFNTSELRKYPQTQILGCDADLWAYGIRELPQANRLKGLRCAGGHIHVGISPWPEKLLNRTVIRLLDMFWFPTAVKHADPYRWRHYGFPGLYRETSYGVEYRSPDNRWCSRLLRYVEEKGAPDSVKLDCTAWMMAKEHLTQLEYAITLLLDLCVKKGAPRANEFIEWLDEVCSFTTNVLNPKYLKGPYPFPHSGQDIIYRLERELRQ